MRNISSRESSEDEAIAYESHIPELGRKELSVWTNQCPWDAEEEAKYYQGIS